MNRILTLSASLLLATSALAGDFGVRPVYPDATLEDVTRRIERYDGKPVRVRGKIADVCQKKGCWLVVTDGKSSMRVKFKDYSFFVPRGSTGAPVILEGVVRQQTISQADARHLASEGKSGSAAGIHGPQKSVGMMADGVWIEGAEPPGRRAPMSEPESGESAGSGSSRR